MWSKKDLVSIDELSRQDIEFVLKCTKILEPFSGKGNKLDVCRGEIATLAFFEPSTRTEKSFQSGMYTLGGDVIIHKDIGSSREKGETKADTLRILEQYSDILVIRDPESSHMSGYSDLLSVPIINAGDGSNEHPTQALLDLYTIKEEIGRLDDISLVFMADLKYGRGVHSLIKALRKFSGNKIYGISPKGLELSGVDMIEISDLKRLSPDIFYITRIQKERIPIQERDKFSFRFDANILSMLSNTSKVMHIMPRVDEMDASLDNDPRVIPFKQARYGLQTRMAVLALMLGHEQEVLDLGKI